MEKFVPGFYVMSCDARSKAVHKMANATDVSMFTVQAMLMSEGFSLCSECAKQKVCTILSVDVGGADPREVLCEVHRSLQNAYNSHNVKRNVGKTNKGKRRPVVRTSTTRKTRKRKRQKKKKGEVGYHNDYLYVEDEYEPGSTKM